MRYTEAYVAGFAKVAEEAGVDPELLLKRAAFAQSALKFVSGPKSIRQATYFMNQMRNRALAKWAPAASGYRTEYDRLRSLVEALPRSPGEKNMWVHSRMRARMRKGLIPEMRSELVKAYGANPSDGRIGDILHQYDALSTAEKRLSSASGEVLRSIHGNDPYNYGKILRDMHDVNMQLQHTPVSWRGVDRWIRRMNQATHGGMTLGSGQM